MEKILTYEELMTLAMEYYTKGGSNVFECWEAYDFDDYVNEFGPMTKSKALNLFKFYKGMKDEIGG